MSPEPAAARPIARMNKTTTHQTPLHVSRRRTLGLLGAAGVAAVARFAEVDAEAASCPVLAGAQTEGPYWVEENLNRSDIRVDPSDGSVRPGTLLNLAINIQDVTSSGCMPLAGARVDLWHCDALGSYSDEAVQSSSGKKYLRGYQVTDDNGLVQFTTIYPGWYSGRTVHIHVRIRTYSGTTKIGEFVAQLFFDDTITDTVFSAQAPYNTRRTRDTRNTNDMVITGTNNGAVLFVNLTQTSTGYSGAASIGVNLKTAAVAPAITSSGVVNGASYAAGIAPGSWVAIFGQNLAATSRTLTSADVVNGTLPTSLGGVTVTIDGQPAFLYYVSPTQINLQAPSSSNTGTVSVTVSNSAGTSSAASAMLQGVSPALFTSGKYAAAVRIDGTVIDGTTGARSGDVLELYGTGFGPTVPTVAAGVVFEGSAPTSNAVTITIGDVPSTVSFAGLVGAGLYQINVVVPTLADGDYAVVCQVAGISTQSGVVLKVQR